MLWIKSRKGLIGVERFKGFCYHWKEKGQCSKGDQRSFRHKSDDRAPKPAPKAAPPSWHEVEVRREEEAPEAEVRLAEFFDNRADAFWKVVVRHHVVSIGILPDVNSLKTEWGCRADLFPHYKCWRKTR